MYVCSFFYLMRLHFSYRFGTISHFFSCIMSSSLVAVNLHVAYSLFVLLVVTRV